MKILPHEFGKSNDFPCFYPKYSSHAGVLNKFCCPTVPASLQSAVLPAEGNAKIDPPYFTTCHFLKPPEHSLSLRHNKAFALKEGFLQEQN